VSQGRSVSPARPFGVPRVLQDLEQPPSRRWVAVTAGLVAAALSVGLVVEARWLFWWAEYRSEYVATVTDESAGGAYYFVVVLSLAAAGSFAVVVGWRISRGRFRPARWPLAMLTAALVLLVPTILAARWADDWVTRAV
jgi:hypothetical protein